MDAKQLVLLLKGKAMKTSTSSKIVGYIAAAICLAFAVTCFCTTWRLWHMPGAPTTLAMFAGVVGLLGACFHMWISNATARNWKAVESYQDKNHESIER